MNTNVQDAITFIINVIEEAETQARTELLEEDALKKDFLAPGWINKINFSWRDEFSFGEKRCFCRFDSDGGPNARYKVPTDSIMDLSFLNKRHIQNEIIPALQNWFSQRVNAEGYGGLYDCNCCLEFSLRVETSDRSRRHEFELKAHSPERESQFKDNVNRFISENHYKTVNIDDIHNSLEKVTLLASNYFLDKLGFSALETFFDVMFTKAEESWSYVTPIISGAFEYSNNLSYDYAYNDVQPTDLQFDLCCYFGKRIMEHPAADGNQKEWGKGILESAVNAGSKKAKQLMKQGSGKIDKKYLTYKDSNIQCTANDMEGEISIKFKHTNQEAFRAAVTFIMALLRQDFPKRYQINIKPASEVYSTGTEQFWSMCGQYSELHPVMRDYVMEFICDGAYYADSEGEMPVGGYATHLLALADIGNSDIVEIFMGSGDSEHYLFLDELAEDYIYKYGVIKDNVSTVLACILHSNNNAMFSSNFSGLEDVEVLSMFLQAMMMQEISGYNADIVVNCIWGGAENLRKKIESESGDKAALLTHIADMADDG